MFLIHRYLNFFLKKRRWRAWDSNPGPGPQDGRRRRNHGAMAATKFLKCLPGKFVTGLYTLTEIGSLSL